MKQIFISNSLRLLSFLLVWLTYTQPALAMHDIQSLYNKTYNAGNTCFPRVFSQIDQFKVSSGGLKNIHPNPRSIICSINSDASNSVYPATPEGVVIYLEFAALPDDMSCTLYTRDDTTAAVISSLTKVFSAGTTNGAFGDPYGLQWFSNYSNSFSYVQCKVPGEGRIFSYTGFFYYMDEI